MMKSALRKLFGAGLMCSALVLALACAKETRFGEAIPSDAPRAALADILKNPAAYNGKDVVAEGIFMGKCCETDFIFTSGINTLEVRVSKACPMPPPRLKGTKARVYGVVRVKGDDVTIHAKGVDFI